MLVRNLRKAGDYERAILSQDENLRMAIANDRNVAQAKAQARQGMVPELTRDQQRSKEEELTDAIAIQAKAQENLLSLYSKELVAKYLQGLTIDQLTYLNVYWNDLKPVFKNKTGLTKTYFDRILNQHIQSIVDSRGMSTVPSSGIKSASLNEMTELNRLGFDWMIGSPLLKGIASKLGRIAEATAAGSMPRSDHKALEVFIASLPTKAVLAKANALPEGKRGAWINRLINAFAGTTSDKSIWETQNAKEGRDFLASIDRLFPTFGPTQIAELQKLYNFID